MKTSVMPVMIEVLDSGDKEKISEILDGIGYMAFYHVEVAKLEYAEKIIDTIERYREDEVIYWKGILCLSGFPWRKTGEYLKSVIEENRNSLFVEEASRSLELLKRTVRG